MSKVKNATESLCASQSKGALRDRSRLMAKNAPKVIDSANVPLVEVVGKVAVPVTEWRIVPPGVACPPGCEYKMNMATGTNMIRVLQPGASSERPGREALVATPSRNVELPKSPLKRKKKEATKEGTSSTQLQVKKAKRDPMAEQFREIILAWEKAPVSEKVKRMLSEILPCSLGEFSDKRHKFQQDVVEAVAGIMAEAEAAFTKEISDARAQQDEAARDKPLREKEVSEATVRVEAAKLETQRLKVKLADSAVAFRAKTASLAEAEEAKKLDAQKSQEAEKKKGDFETALQDLNFLKTISAEEAEAHEKLHELVKLLKKHQFEEAVMISLPVALAKVPETRGKFDLMTIAQLEDEIGKRASEQESILIAAEPGQEKCRAAVQEAQEHLDRARAEQRVAAKSFDTASKHQATCEEALTETQKAMCSLASLLKRLESAAYAAEAELEVFHQGPMETFKTLRERTAPAPVVEEEVVASLAVEEHAIEVQEAEVPAVAAC